MWTRNLIRSLSVAMVICLSATTSQAQVPISQETEALIQLLKACDKSLNSCEAVSQAKDNKIAVLESVNEAQAQRLLEMEPKWYDNPILWAVVGAALTGTTIAVLK